MKAVPGSSSWSFTAVACMANTNPVVDNAAVVGQFYYGLLKRATAGFAIGSITRAGREGTG